MSEFEYLRRKGNLTIAMTGANIWSRNMLNRHLSQLERISKMKKKPFFMEDSLVDLTLVERGQYVGELCL
jgi:hypothetical protein